MPARRPDAGEGARGFVGTAFRLQSDMKVGRHLLPSPRTAAPTIQERRNHAVQCASSPDWPWFPASQRPRRSHEAYVDLVPGAWTKIKIEVRGDRARLYVHGQEQPTLIVNDVKTGAQAKGAVALSPGPGTIAHFRNLTIQP